MFVCRLAAPGWVNFTGSLGHGAVFKNGVSVNPLNARQIARIGSSTMLVNDETGDQVGPSVLHNFLQAQNMTVPTALKTQKQTDTEFEFDRDKLAAEEITRKKAQAEAFTEAQRKAVEQVESVVVYSRAELEAIAANDGITGLREIAKPYGVKGRGIGELVSEILTAQNKMATD